MRDWSKVYYVDAKDAPQFIGKGGMFDLAWCACGKRLIHNYGRPIWERWWSKYRVHQESIDLYESMLK